MNVNWGAYLLDRQAIDLSSLLTEDRKEKHREIVRAGEVSQLGGDC